MKSVYFRTKECLMLLWSGLELLLMLLVVKGERRTCKIHLELFLQELNVSV